jgi:ribose/xylose/arabinose/galactoside ABC-type transport system permease subunit
MTLYTGIGMALTGGKGVTGLPEAFTDFGIIEVYGVPLVFLLFLAAVLILSLVLNWTAFGRKVYSLAAIIRQPASPPSTTSA